MTTKTLLPIVLLSLVACGGKEAPSATPTSPLPDAGASGDVAVSSVTTPAPTVASAPAATAVKEKATPRATAKKLEVKRLVLARGGANREPLDADTVFNAKESRVWAFVELENPERAPGQVFVSFEPPKGKPSGEVALAVGDGARWRTWAFTRQAHESGEWHAIVRDDHGRELARQAFEVRL